ncbi:hypothetical protein FOA52_009015 [Chlamydomonas sp. UWO 241]|nr:hypothetical protein FOA52_009015 [Chlamydomonas sp. UWO 241]
MCQGDALESVEQGVDAERGASALQDNIAKNGNQSYYYAHKSRDTGEEPAPPPVHVVLDTVIVEVAEVTDDLHVPARLFLDDGTKVKVYVPLEGVGAAIGDDGVVCDFQARSLQVCIRGYKPNRCLRLAVKELGGEVDPRGCSFRRLPNKVVVTLAKAESGKSATWPKLSAK